MCYYEIVTKLNKDNAMSKIKRNKNNKKRINWKALSTGADALWDSFSQIARLVGGVYLVYQYLFESIGHIQSAWQLAVGGALLVDFAIEVYRINLEARNNTHDKHSQ